MKTRLLLALGGFFLVSASLVHASFFQLRSSGSTESSGYLVAEPCIGLEQPNAPIDGLAISHDGRKGAAETAATNLIVADTNGLPDIFLIDIRFPFNIRVSVGPNGLEADGGSYNPSLSASGFQIAFASDATNLVGGPGDTRPFRDIFVHDRTTATTDRVSIRADGKEPNGNSFQPAISANGRFVVFASNAGDLVANDRNSMPDIFLYNRRTGATIRVSVSATGGDPDGPSRNPAVSRNGKLIAFESEATNLLAQTDNFPYTDIFLYNVTTGTMRRLSGSHLGGESNGNSSLPGLDSMGRFCAFESEATDLIANDGNAFMDVFLRDLAQKTTTRVSEPSGGGIADGDSGGASVSRFGRVAFWSDATNLVPSDGNGLRDTFLHDRLSSATVRASVAGDGSEATGPSFAPVISDQGRDVAFLSDATDLIPDDGNGVRDMFWHRPSAFALALETRPLVVKPGKNFALTVRGGQPGQTALLFAVFVNQAPIQVLVAQGFFDGAGEFKRSWTFPSGLSCNTLSFLAIGILPNGKVGGSNIRWNYADL